MFDWRFDWRKTKQATPAVGRKTWNRQKLWSHPRFWLVFEGEWGTCCSTAASSVLLWCLKSREFERWRRCEAEARRSRRGEECIRPLAAANWRPERPQPHHQEEEGRQKGGVGATGDDVSMGPQTRYYIYIRARWYQAPMINVGLDDPPHMYFNVKLNFKASLFSSTFYLSSPLGWETQFKF